MATTFVTAAQKAQQVTSHQARLAQANTFGGGRYLLDGLKLTMETSNRLKAGAGVMLVDGSYVTVDEAGETWTIANGEQGKKRIDIAGYEYTAGEDGMESLKPAVKKGTPDAAKPAPPDCGEGTMIERPSKLFIPIARVELDGITAKQPQCLLAPLAPMDAMSAYMLGDAPVKVLTRDISMFMEADTTESLSEPVSKQRNGVVLVWSAHDGSSTKDWTWTYTFVPKWHGAGRPGTAGVVCSGINKDGIMAKYVYLSDNKVTGHEDNYQNFSVGGATVNNKAYVLRYVLGV